jgi:uncharacterized protein (TIGR02246 family)
MRHTLGTAVVALAAVAFTAPAQAKSQQVSSADRQAIQQIDQKWMELENKGDAKGVTSLFTKDALQISVNGLKRGATEIERQLEAVQKMGVSIKMKSVDMMPVPGGKAVLEYGTYEVSYTNNPTTTNAHGNWMRLFVKEGSEWKIQAQNLTREGTQASTAAKQ